MSEHKATVKWERGGAEFSYQKYPRDHTWSFDGGHTMTATAAPAYLGNPANVDPEEAFVASLSSCHMLTFLAIACRQKFVLDAYEDRVERGSQTERRGARQDAPCGARELFHCQFSQDRSNGGERIARVNPGSLPLG